MTNKLPYERKAIPISDEALLKIARDILNEEARCLINAAKTADSAIVEAARTIASCKGRIAVSGIGKSGHIARKIAATLASLGAPAFFLHAVEGVHGDLGMVCREDAGIFLSNSGQTKEVLELVPFFKKIGAPIIALTGNAASPLARCADIAINCAVEKEADPLGLAPTSSTTLQLATGDALAGMVTALQGLNKEDFALFHPAGALGKKLLLRVEDVMSAPDRLPRKGKNTTVRVGLFEITSKGYGAVAVTEDDSAQSPLAGIFTDGDLRRLMEINSPRCMDMSLGDVMTKNPRTISPAKLAAEALRIMEDNEISVLIAVENSVPVGIVHIHDLLKAGLS